MKSLDHQVAGNHYRKYAIQPVEYTVRNDLSFLAGSVIKYVTRYKDKGGAEDIRKAMHYLELILEFEYPDYPDIGHPGNITRPPEDTTIYETPRPTGPELILKLESQDPDTVGELTNGRLDNQTAKSDPSKGLRAPKQTKR